MVPKTAKARLRLGPDCAIFEIAGGKVVVDTAGFGPRQFVSRATGHASVRGFEKNDFRFWHSPKDDAATALLDTVFFAEGWTPILNAPQTGWKINGCLPAFACAETIFVLPGKIE
jgi:hypothetical protein